jgi:hypothetical protein
MRDWIKSDYDYWKEAGTNRDKVVQGGTRFDSML